MKALTYSRGITRDVFGFEPVAGGEIRLEGQTVSKPGWSLAPEKRRIGMVWRKSSPLADKFGQIADVLQDLMQTRTSAVDGTLLRPAQGDA